MSRLSTHAWPRWRAAGAIAVAGVAFAACGTVPTTVVPPISGRPSTSISVPLTTVACTATDACVAVGTSTTVVPAAVGEYLVARSSWRALSAPDSTSPLVTTASCWSGNCLLGGSQSSGDLLWLFQSRPASLTSIAGPPGGHDVEAVDCFATSTCALVDSTGVSGVARLDFTYDGGVSWNPPIDLSWSSGEAVSSLACADAFDCIVVANQSSEVPAIEVTHDGGVTWSLAPTPLNWTSLTSLSCRGPRCVGVVTTTSGSAVVTTLDYAGTWQSVPLAATASGVACASATSCVVAGETSSQQPWLATLSGRTLRVKRLQYVPSPLTGVACGKSVCAAIAASTVLSLRP